MKLKNDKIIVINAFSRGGSNIAWNIMQSHPSVCSAILETDEILYPQRPRRLRVAIRPLFTNKLAASPPLVNLLGHVMDERFYNLKLRNLADPDNRYQSEGVLYTSEGVERSALCLKSLDRDINLTDLTARVYGEDNCYFVGLVRNGYALCEGWLRRGGRNTARDWGRIYRRYVEKMLDDSQKYPRYTIAKLEDLLQDPFGEAERLYEFAELAPTRLEKLRFKVKRVMSEKGEHRTAYGEENRKYWFTRENVHELLVPDVSSVQASRLSPEDREAFEREAGPVLERLGYF